MSLQSSILVEDSYIFKEKPFNIRYNLFCRKCQRPGCPNTCNNVRSAVKNFCSPNCAQVMTSASKQEPRRVFTELHNTLPRSSKSEDDLLSRGHKSTRTSITSPVKEKKAFAASAVNTTPSNHITDEKKVRLMQYYLFTIIRYICT